MTLQTEHPQLYTILRPVLEHEFVLDGSGIALNTYKRRSGSLPAEEQGDKCPAVKEPLAVSSAPAF